MYRYSSPRATHPPLELASRTVKELMLRDPRPIHPDTTLEEAARLIKAAPSAALPVCDGPSVIGLLTARDLTLWTAAESADPRLARVRDVISPNPPFAYEDQSALEAASLLERHTLQHLLVLNHDHRLVGLVSLSELLNG